MEDSYFYKIILSYKGTQYSGWQRQTVNPSTVQEAFEKVLSGFVNFQQIQVIAASRTDTGVHAQGQVVKVKIPKEISPENLKRGLNTKLPSDIKVITCKIVDKSFNVNKDVLSKEYNYFFCHQKLPKATLFETVFYQPELLNIELMQKACHEFIGTHDLTHFCVKGGRDIDPVRTITECSIIKTSFSPIEEEVYYLKIKASGFLKYSVRFIMGALFDIGLEKIDIKTLKRALECKEESFTKKKAPPHGLHLIKIQYE